MKKIIKNAGIALLSLAALVMTEDSQAQTTQDSNVQYLTNGIIKVGIDLNKGGSITYLSSNTDDRNLINSYDLGRQVQLSFYSGPIPFQPTGTTLSTAWEKLGWNPIQTGDFAGNMSKIIDFKNYKDSLFVKLIPMQWPLNNVPCECTMESWIKVSGNQVIVRARINNHRADTNQYTAKFQELPAVYTNAPFKQLYSYTGPKPFTNDTLSVFLPKKDGDNPFPATEHWAALVDKNKYGVGIYNDATAIFSGGFFGDLNADGGPKDFPTGYMAPHGEEILDHNISYQYQYNLIVGNLSDIRKAVYKLAKPHSSSVSYKFDHDRQHWAYRNALDKGWPIENWLDVTITDTCRLISPTDAWQADKHRRVRLSLVYKSANTTLKLGWRKHLSINHETDGDMGFKVNNDGQFHNYDLMISSAAYNGMIMGISLLVDKPKFGTDRLQIKSIELY